MIDLEPSDLLLYFGDDYVINEHITIHQPVVGEIIPCEKEYFSTVHTLTAIPSDLKSQLWDLKLDWNTIEDFELFRMLAPTLPKERTQILFGDLDFSEMKQYMNNQNGNIVLANKETGVIIDEMIYLRIVKYLRKLHHITPKVEKTKSKTVKKWLIEEDRKRIESAQDKPFRSYLLPIISSVKVRQGYTKDYVRNMGFYELMDEVERLNIIVGSDALLHGMYGGMIDTKKIDRKELNWMREL